MQLPTREELIALVMEQENQSKDRALEHLADAYLDAYRGCSGGYLRAGWGTEDRARTPKSITPAIDGGWPDPGA